MSIRSTLKLPREHGAWAMVYVPFVLGVLVGGQISLPVLLLLISTSVIFISRESLLVWWRARNRGRQSQQARQAGKLLAAYSVIAIGCGAPLIFVYRLYWLLPLLVVGLTLLLINGKQATEFEERSTRSEVMAIVGLTMAAPAAYYVGRSDWDQTAWWLWALNAAYFASSVFYVKQCVASFHARRQDIRQRVKWNCSSYHAFLLVSLLALALTNNLPLFALIAFLPALVRAFWGLLRPAQQLNLKRIGVAEIIYSLLFLVFVTLTFRYRI